MKQAIRWPDFHLRAQLRAALSRGERVHFPERPDASLINSWKFLVPFGLICVGMVLARAWGFV